VFGGGVTPFLFRLNCLLPQIQHYRVSLQSRQTMLGKDSGLVERHAVQWAVLRMPTFRFSCIASRRRIVSSKAEAASDLVDVGMNLITSFQILICSATIIIILFIKGCVYHAAETASFNSKLMITRQNLRYSICGNKMPTRCNRWIFYFRSYCLLNMFRTPLCPLPANRTHNPQLHTTPTT
jgi:hypothetical protein